MIGATLAILGASLVGSVHCAAMCGSFTCFYASSNERDTNGNTSGSAVRSHALYNAGRLGAYMSLGAVAGRAGGHVTHAAAWVGVARGAAVVAGLLMIVWAISSIAAQRGLHVPAPHAPLAWQKAIGSALGSLRNQSVAVRAIATGLLTGLIPCGWLYVFVSTAAATGSAIDGATVMAVFWLGTVPALVAVGIGAQRLLTPLRARLPQLSALIVLLMGALTMAGRVGFSHAH